MNCDELSGTGLPVLPFLLPAVVVLIVGMLLLAGTRRRRNRLGAVVLVILLGAGVSVALPASSAQAAAADCEGPPPAQGAGNSLTITQTSTMSGLGPGVPAAAITGLVVNNSAESTFVEAITVSIVSVVPLPDASAGTCTASDYVLLEPRMRIASVLGPGASMPFSGASIGFSDKPTDQDRCQGATVLLLYQT